jgi:hypothetical protein
MNVEGKARQLFLYLLGIRDADNGQSMAKFETRSPVLAR